MTCPLEIICSITYSVLFHSNITMMLNVIFYSFRGGKERWTK